MTQPWLTIYVGGVPPAADEQDLQHLFAEHGAVRRVTLLPDPVTATHRGLAFVEMPCAAARTAIAALDGLPWRGGVLRVNESRDRGAPAPRRSY